VLNRLIQKVSWFFKKEQECFLVVEELDHGIDVIEGQVDHPEKKVRIVRKGSVKGFNAIRRRPFFYDRLVVALEPTRATTVESTARVKRAKADLPIDEGELDALVFKALWEFLNRYRAWVAKKMGVSDFDLVLAHIEIKEVRVGGHRLLNPVGFKGPDFSVRFRGTFVPRTVVPILERFHEWAAEVVAIERGTMLMGALTGPDDHFVDSHEARTAIFSRKDDESLYMKELMWGFDNVRRAVAGELSVSPAVAEALLRAAASGSLSDRFGRFIDRTVRGAFHECLDLVQRATERSAAKQRATTHLHFRFSVPRPEALVSDSRLSIARFDRSLGAQGFEVSAARRVADFDPAAHQETLAILLYPYTHPHYAFLNQLLARRAKWLIPHPTER
jgi:hypothetical protein